MESEMKSLMKACISGLASLSYCYFIVTKIPTGKIRLLSLLPIFYLFTILPLSFSTITLRGTTVFFITWLCNFKLLLLSFDQGPLSSNPPKSLPLFISIACLPIKIKQDLSPQKATTGPKSSSSLAIKGLLLAILAQIYGYKQYVFPKVLLVLYVYLALEVLLAMGAALARVLLGLELEPQFDEPYLSTSLQDFWGRRWNLMITSILRPTIYHPIRCMSTPMLGRRGALLLAVVATFIVSGLMHELIFFYITSVDPTWEVTWFFVLQGICTAMEIAVKKTLSNRWKLHQAISGPLAVGFVVVTSMWLFVPPVVRSGSDFGIGEFGATIEIVKEKLLSTIHGV